MVLSSSSVHLSLLISGFRWLCHRSLHCFPMRPGSCLAIALQFFAPLPLTSLRTISSSSLVLIKEGLPKALWWDQGWAPSAIGGGTGRQCDPAGKMLFSSSSWRRTIIQVVWVSSPLGESTSASELSRNGHHEGNSQIIFVDIPPLRFYWPMRATLIPYPKCFESWWNHYWPWTDLWCCRRAFVVLHFMGALNRLITTITANLLPTHQIIPPIHN